jgi:uncharacterized protein
VRAQVILMSERKFTPEPSMDEILGSIRRILAEDDHAAAPVRSRASDVLDLTEALDDDGGIRHITPVALVTPEPSASSLPGPARADRRIEPVPPRTEGTAAEPRLVSEAASEAVAASFGRLAGLPRGGSSEVPVEDIVRETLRPMLQAWLDENLPALVERLVRAEIARVVGAIRPTAP